ncbi:hypothetical protein H4R35_001037 [Dimargaris xerosporica]|nr:hypothetical protein H4R35_001037 [Dimargaris xerosporica]
MSTFNNYGGFSTSGFGGATSAHGTTDTTASSGGGFMNQSPFSNEGGATKRGGLSAQTIRPVTIRQILNLEAVGNDEPVILDGHELTQVALVVNVRKVTQQTAFVIFTLEDGTGALEARMSIGDNAPAGTADEVLQITENTYVRVVAQLRFFAKKRQLYVNKIVPLMDMNEITLHLLSVIKVHHDFTKPSTGSGVAGATVTGGNFGLSNANPYQPQQQQPLSSGSNMFGADLTPPKSNIVKLVQQHHDREEGVSIDYLSNQLRQMVGPSEIETAVEWLINEGHLYFTIDDRHVKCTYN